MRARLVLLVLMLVIGGAVVAHAQGPTSEPGPDQKTEKPPPDDALDPEDIDPTLEVLGTVERGEVVVTLPNGKRVVLDTDRNDEDQASAVPFGSRVDATRGRLRIGK